MRSSIAYSSMPDATPLRAWLLRAWYERPAPWLLRPIALLFGGLIALRKFAYRHGWLASVGADVPVVVVGNIAVGGTGKTPLVIWLAQQLQQRQIQVGIVTRGYGGHAGAPTLVHAASDPALVGDEAVMMAQHCAARICSGRDRVRGVRLLAEQGCELILSDDGLQHYRLQRNLEVAVVDAARGYGNSWLLPAGPLREPVERLAAASLIVSNGGAAPLATPAGPEQITMQLVPGALLCLGASPAGNPPLPPAVVHAVAGIGNPQRFFATLRQLGFSPIEHVFPDHHAYTQVELDFADSLPIVMTEKDAVKCRRFASPRMWFLPVAVQFDAAAAATIVRLVQDCAEGYRK